jgi:hypothetical protein
MSGTPKYSSVSYSAARAQAVARERAERERRRQREMQQARERAMARANQQEQRAAGLLAEIDSEAEYVERGLAFAPQMSGDLRDALSGIERARSMHAEGHNVEAEGQAREIKSKLSQVRARVDESAQELALRLDTVEALIGGLRARGYEVTEPLVSSEGTLAVRATSAGQAGIDLAVTAGDPADEIVWQRHDAISPEGADVACPSLIALHEDLRSELGERGIELGRLWWPEDGAAAEKSHSRQDERGVDQR